MKRLWNVGVLLLAGLMFFLVPVGRKTPAQHLFAIVSTPPAREAAASFAGAVRRAGARAGEEIAALRRPRQRPAREPSPTSPSSDP